MRLAAHACDAFALRRCFSFSACGQIACLPNAAFGHFTFGRVVQVRPRCARGVLWYIGAAHGSDEKERGGGGRVRRPFSARGLKCVLHGTRGHKLAIFNWPTALAFFSTNRVLANRDSMRRQELDRPLDAVWEACTSESRFACRDLFGTVNPNPNARIE